MVSKKPNPDLYEQRLQLHLVNRINTLMSDEKLNSIIKGLLLELKKDIKTFATIRSILCTDNDKAHFKYLKKISK